MPRFATNLGYNSLEPLKPTAVDSSQIQSTVANNKNGGTSSNEPALGEVPAAQFDWNSSGLVNPLDGKIICFKFVSPNSSSLSILSYSFYNFCVA